MTYCPDCCCLVVFHNAINRLGRSSTVIAHCGNCGACWGTENTPFVDKVRAHLERKSGMQTTARLDDFDPCPFVYKNGRRCDGNLSIVAYADGKTSETRHRYVIIECSKKGGHGLEPFESDAHCEAFGYTKDELIDRFELTSMVADGFWLGMRKR